MATVSQVETKSRRPPNARRTRYGTPSAEVDPVFVDAARGGHEAPRIPLRVEAGDPVHELREQGAWTGVQMLAVGSRGHGPVRRALLGSVSAALAATAACPVLVVPPTATLGDALDPARRNGAIPA